MRLTVWQYWLAMAVLGGLIYGATLSGAPAAVGAAVIVASLVGVVLSRWRFDDLGWDPDDALVALVPVANLWVFYRCLFQGTPSADTRAKRIAKWERAYGPNRVGAVKAVLEGGRAWVAALPVFAPAAAVGGLAYGGANNGVLWLLNWIRTGDPKTLESTTQMLGGSAAFLLLFALIQASRRGRVTRASWIPALFALPTALVALALWLRTSRDLGMAVLSLPYEALDLIWSAIVGGTLAALWLAVGAELAEGRSLSDAWSRGAGTLRARWGDVVAVHGGAQTAIWIGMQVLLPGVHYAITYAFVDHAAVLHPDKAAYAWSTDVARGIRSRVFLTQFLAFLPYLVPAVAITIATAGLDPNAWVTAFMDPTTTPWWQHAISGALWFLSAALIKLSLLALYRDRVAMLTAPVLAAAPAPADAKNPFAPPSEARG